MSKDVYKNPKPEIATPHTSFVLAKSIQAFGFEVLEHTDERYLKEQAEDDSVRFMITSDEDYCGRLEDWDGRFFSFAKFGVLPEDEHPDAALPHCMIRIDLRPKGLPGIPPPDGTIMTLNFDTLHRYVEKGDTFQRVVSVRHEGPPLVKDYVRDDPVRVDEWRELSESESQDLLFDIADLKTRLDDYLATHNEPLFSE